MLQLFLLECFISTFFTHCVHITYTYQILFLIVQFAIHANLDALPCLLAHCFYEQKLRPHVASFIAKTALKAACGERRGGSIGDLPRSRSFEVQLYCRWCPRLRRRSHKHPNQSTSQNLTFHHRPNKYSVFFTLHLLIFYKVNRKNLRTTNTV